MLDKKYICLCWIVMKNMHVILGYSQNNLKNIGLVYLTFLYKNEEVNVSYFYHHSPNHFLIIIVNNIRFYLLIFLFKKQLY